MNQDMLMYAVTALPVVLFSLSVHEAAHAITARWGGDYTADSLGRVTLNPISHIDPIGTILLPILAVITGIPLIGWAKPVPTVDSNYTRGKSYGVIVAMAGPFSNLLIALFCTVIFGALIMLVDAFPALGWLMDGRLMEIVFRFLQLGIMVNISLMFFNLIPIPPLDGSWPVWYWLVRGNPGREETFFAVARFGGPLLLLLLWTGLIGTYLMFVHSNVTMNLFNYLTFIQERLYR